MTAAATVRISDSLQAAKDAFDLLEDAVADQHGSRLEPEAGYLRVVALALIAIATELRAK